MAGLAVYRRLGDEGPCPWLRFDGGLRWGAPGDTVGLREMWERQTALGYPAEWLSRSDVVQRITGVDPVAVPPEGGVFNAAEGWVELSLLIAHLCARLRGLGGVVVEQAGRVRPRIRAERVTAVQALGREHRVDAVVLATGADVPRDLGEIGVHLPDRTTPALLVRTAPVPTGLRVVLHTPAVALRPAPDGGLVMDSGWSEREVEIGEGGALQARPSTVRRLLDEARRVLRGHPPLELHSVGVGPKPIPEDGQPVLGRVARVEGYHVAFSHSGATIALSAAELVAEEVLAQRPEPRLEPFRLDRFDRPADRLPPADHAATGL